MHLSNDALHRILSVPMVDTAGVTSYQLQDLWISPAAMVRGGLTTLQASQLLNDGVFWRLEPILFCDQAIKDLGDSIEYPEDFYGLKSAVSQYPSQYELSCRAGIMNESYPFGVLQKDANSSFYSQTINSLDIGSKIGTLPYVYKPIKVSKVAFVKLTEWKHGFSVSRNVGYSNDLKYNAVDFSDSENDSISYTEADFSKIYFDSLRLDPVGLDEYAGSFDEKFFTFAPKLELSELNTAVFQTLTEPNAIGWNYTPLEAKTTSQPFPTNTTTQIVYIKQEVAKLFPLDTSPGAEATTVQVQYLRDLASNYCSQFDWASQSRDFDAVALRQRRLLDFNAIPIAPLELGKDYATLATSPDMGLQCYGDLPALAWAPDPADESKVFALCRYRPPLRVPLPDWDWADIGLPNKFSQSRTKVKTTDGGWKWDVVQSQERKPFIYWFELLKNSNFSPATYTHKIRQASSNLFGHDFFTNYPEGMEVQRKIISRVNYNRSVEVGPLHNPLKYEKLGYDKYTLNNVDVSNCFTPGFSPKMCVLLAPKFLVVGAGFAEDNPDDPLNPLTKAGGAFLTKTGDGQTFTYALTKTGSESVQADLEGFKAWADEFFLSEASYKEIGRYRWLDENGKAMVDEPFFGHAEIFSSFNIDIRLTPAPA